MEHENKPLVYADVHRTTMPVPPRYAAELPVDHAGWLRLLSDDDPSFPTAAHVHSALAAGDPSMQERIVRSMRSTLSKGWLSKGGPFPEKFLDQLPVVWGYEAPSPAFCRWAVGIVTGAEPAAVRTFFWRYLARCNVPKQMTLFTRDDVPAAVIVRFCKEHEHNHQLFPPDVKYVDLLIRAIRQLASTDDEVHLRLGAVLLAWTHDPRALVEIVTLEKATTNATMRAHLTFAANEAKKPQQEHSTKEMTADAPSSATLEARLRDLGLLPSVDDMQIALESDIPQDAHDLLMRGHRLIRFDTETDDVVNHHDGLLGQLAAMAQPALRGIVFEEVPPSEADPEHYELRAYKDGELISTRARNLGDWYDVRAVVGLLNMLSRERHSDLRFADVTTGGQESDVAVGPEGGLLQAFEAGVLKAASPDAGTSVGKRCSTQRSSS